jgi:hypothetical protein
MITNAGFEGRAHQSLDANQFLPDSMTVSNLTISRSANTTNTLLLNYFGTALPLTVSNGLRLQDTTRAIVNFNSGLAVQSGTNHRYERPISRRRFQFARRTRQCISKTPSII